MIDSNTKTPIYEPMPVSTAQQIVLPKPSINKVKPAITQKETKILCISDAKKSAPNFNFLKGVLLLG